MQLKKVGIEARPLLFVGPINDNAWPVRKRISFSTIASVIFFSLPFQQAIIGKGISAESPNLLQLPYDACMSGPCHNNGHCNTTTAGLETFICQCQPQFVGNYFF